MKYRLYIAGPMTGLPLLNFPAFHSAAKQWRDLGHEVINPAELNPDPNATWNDCMRIDIAALMTCTGIVLLPGWRNSKGARLEHHNAEQLGFEIVEA